MAVPQGFALTIDAFRLFALENHLAPLFASLNPLDPGASAQFLRAVETAVLPRQVEQEIDEAVTALLDAAARDPLRLAVRSSCNYEDLPGLSFAGMYESYLDIAPESVARNVIRCYQSLFSPRSLAYLGTHGLDLQDVAMGVLVQELVEAKSAGTIFTAEPESGFTGLHRIEGAWGFGEGVVAGTNAPNSWSFSKKAGRIISRSLGELRTMYVGGANGAGSGLCDAPVPEELRNRPCLTDGQVAALAAAASRLEDRAAHPLDIEWAADSEGGLWFLQARPLSIRDDPFFVRYDLSAQELPAPILTGFPVTQKAVTGRARCVLTGPCPLESGEILVVPYLTVDWLSSLRNAGGVIVETGGHTSHISIILREHGIPAIFAAEGACRKVSDGQFLTLVCSGDQGLVWEGAVEVKREIVDLSAVPKPRHSVSVVTSTLTNLDRYLRLPLSGVGLVRLEFLVHSGIGVHPLALIDYDNGVPQSPELKAAIEEKTRGFESKREYYIQKLTEGIAAIACRCPDKHVNVRAPDFITGDYLALLGGPDYEHERENNPMMGWRGVTRLIDHSYVPAFEMDCEAFRRVVEDYGFTNVNILVPFCRTPADGAAVRAILKAKGPARASVGMMVEIPSNVMLARQFAEVFDFFLVGPMDMTQLTYGADRTSWRMSHYCNETEAVKEMVKYFLTCIRGCQKDVYIGGWPLFQYLREYNQVRSNNRICLVELPDRLIELFESVVRLEQSLGGDQT